MQALSQTLCFSLLSLTPQLPFEVEIFKLIIAMRKLDPSPAGLKAGPRDRDGFSHYGKWPLRCFLSQNSFPLASPDTQRVNMSQGQVLPAEAAVAVGWPSGRRRERGLSQTSWPCSAGTCWTPILCQKLGGGQQGHTDKVGVGLALKETDLYEGAPRRCRQSRRDEGAGLLPYPRALVLRLLPACHWGTEFVPNVTSGSRPLLWMHLAPE